MVELTDITLIESSGNYYLTKEIMESDGPPTWMISTKAIVSSEGMSFGYLLHLWNNGEVVIMATERPQSKESPIPDYDLRELHDWAFRNGWISLQVHKDLIADPSGFEFWMNEYRAGIVESKEFTKYEEEENNRLSSITDEGE